MVNKSRRLAVVAGLEGTPDNDVLIFDLTTRNGLINTIPRSSKRLLPFTGEVKFWQDGTTLAFTTDAFDTSTINIIFVTLKCFNDPIRDDCETYLAITDNSGERRYYLPQKTVERWRNPRFSPTDPQRLAFRCDGICLINMDGSKFKRFDTFYAYYLFWENGQSLFYSASDGIYRLSLSSQKSTLLYKFTEKKYFDNVSLLTEEAVRQLTSLKIIENNVPNIYLKSLNLVEICTLESSVARLWRVSNPNPVFIDFKIEFIDLPTNAAVRADYSFVFPPGRKRPSHQDFFVRKTDSVQEARITVDGILQTTIRTDQSICQPDANH